MRLSAGGGSAKTELEEPGASLEFSGPAGDVNFAIGGIVSPNLAVHGTLFGWAISDPDMTVVGYEFGTQNVDLTLGAVGAGITYYFMPANFYVSPSIGIGSLTLDVPGQSFESETGVVLDLTAGKEWWVGNNWGLGVAGAIGTHSIPEKGTDENWSGVTFAIRFSATLN